MPRVASATPRPLQRQAGGAPSGPWEVRAVGTCQDNGSRGDVKPFWAALELARLKFVAFFPHCDHGGPRGEVAWPWVAVPVDGPVLLRWRELHVWHRGWALPC